MSKIKKVGEVLLELANGYSEYVERSFSVQKFWYWDYYESIKRDLKDDEERRKIYQQIYHLERFDYFSKKGFSAKGLLKIRKIKTALGYREEKWDERWRIVIFDIPEKIKNTRDRFRFLLQGLGFKKLQNSIWVNSHGDLNDIQEIVKDYGIEKYVILIASDKISNDLYFKEQFDL